MKRFDFRYILAYFLFCGVGVFLYLVGWMLYWFGKLIIWLVL